MWGTIMLAFIIAMWEEALEVTEDMNNDHSSSVPSGEFLDAQVINEGSAARYSLALDRITALETALRRHMEQMHNLHHVDIVHKKVKGWEECGMSSCRNARRVLDEKWWEVKE